MPRVIVDYLDGWIALSEAVLLQALKDATNRRDDVIRLDALIWLADNGYEQWATMAGLGDLDRGQIARLICNPKPRITMRLIREGK